MKFFGSMSPSVRAQFMWRQQNPHSLSILTPRQEEVLVYVEAAGTLLYDLRRSFEVSDVIVSFSTFYRTVTGRSVVGSTLTVFSTIAKELQSFLPFWQSNTQHDWIDVLDGLHKNVHRVSGSALGKKVISVFNHVIAHTFYHKMGVEVDQKLFAKIEKGYIRPTVWACLTFADAIVALLLFLAKAGRQALLTGNPDAFFVDSDIVSEWLGTATRLRKDAEFLGNPGAVGIDTPQYLSDVESCIQDGKRLIGIFTDYQKSMMLNMIVELEMIEKRHLSTLAASSFRRAPVGINLFGDSGLAKSFIAKGLFNHYCSVRGVDAKRATLYPRNPDDKYYSGYKSHYMGVIYDDVAKHRSNKVLGIDQSLTDLISAINNIPLITNQAEAHDKGKIPFLSEWVGITSNIADLSVHEYYNNTFAVYRRLPYRIEPIVKDAFRVPGTTSIDPSLIPAGEQYPDCWRFEVCEVKQHDDNKLHGMYVDRGSGKMYESYADLLVWLTDYYEKHIANQDKLMTSVASIGPEVLCKCRLPKSICDCPMLFGSSSALSTIVDPQVNAREVYSEIMNEDAQERIQAILALKSELLNKCEGLAGLEAVYARRWWLRDLPKECLSYTWEPIPGSGVDNVNISEKLREKFLKDMKIFRSMPIRAKAVAMTPRAGETLDSEAYLTFVPHKNGPCNFLRGQLKQVYDYILDYVRVAGWDAKQMAALEVFVYDKAPKYISEGWDDHSLLLGAIDYVDTYASELYDPERMEVRRILLDDSKCKTKWFDGVCRWAGYQYFSRPWLRNSVNYVVMSRPGTWVIDKVGPMLTHPRMVSTIFEERARVYDDALCGKNSLVLLVTSVLGTAVMATIITLAFKMFRTKKQVDVREVGRKPTVREEEKVNVWRVEERNITSLDFQPNRCNSLKQLCPKIRRNTVYVRFVGDAPAGRIRGNTRALVINNTTLVMNNHSCFAPGTLEVFVGDSTKEGVKPSFLIELVEEMITRHADRDIAIIRTMAIPALFKNIQSNLVNRSFSSTGPCFYALREENGEDGELEVYGVRRHQLSALLASDTNRKCDMQAYAGRPQRPTVKGECGSPLVMVTGFGPVIVGIHCAYNSLGSAFSAPIYADDFILEPMVEVGVVTPSVTIAQVNIEALRSNDKLYTDFHDEGHLVVFGQLRGFRPRPKANGMKTEIAEYVLDHGKDFGLDPTDRLGRPDMGSWAPQQNILKEYLKPTHSMNEYYFRIACESFVQHISSNLSPEDIEDIHPVPLRVAVNGFPGVPNVDAQKFTTSAGHGHPGPKLKYVVSDAPTEEWSRCREYDESIVAEVQQIFDLACKGIRSHAIFTSQLKDEMVSLAKVMAKKTRGFYMCPLAFLTAMRLITSGITRVMVRRRSVFRHAVGLNTHSEEWNELFSEASKISGDSWMAGDFKGFDKILSILIQNGAKFVILELARIGGFNDEELLALDTMLSDTITPCVDFFGVLIMLLGGEVSGHQITTFFNSICNILLHLYSWVVLAVKHGYEAHTAATMFFHMVFICVLGDDIMAKISEETPWYNHTTVQTVFKTIGIEYTMADKRSVSIPYISYRDVTFLKRTFREHEAFPGQMVAPLEADSIYKMLIYTIPSKAVSSQEQLAMAFCSAQAEAFYHGRKFFDAIWNLIEAVPKSEELKERMLEFPRPTWYQLYERYMNSSPQYRVMSMTPGLTAEETSTPMDSYCQQFGAECQTSWRMDPWGSTTMERSSEDSFQNSGGSSTKKFHKHQRNDNITDVATTFVTKNFRKHNHNPTQDEREMTPPVVEQVINKVRTKRFRSQKREAWKNKVVWQMDAVYDSKVSSAASGNSDIKQETTLFRSEPIHETLNLGQAPSDVVNAVKMSQDLGEYMRRPKLIHSQSWAESAPTGVLASFNPYDLYLGTTAVANKLQGFSLLRGNLHIKFTINGSPFYYGALAAMYTPLQGYRADTATGPTNTLLVASSQKPHVWLNPQDRSSAEMVLPFVYPYAFVDTQLRQSLVDLAKIEYIVYYGLQSANGVTGQTVDIQAFAWMEDVQLAGPSDQAVAQADVEYEDDHQISQVASTVASVAGKLKFVPGLAPYATATEAAAKVAGSVASFFGYTNVPNISDVAPMKQVPFSLASASISEPIAKLSLQPKQEIAVGSTQYGAPSEDPLSIASFAQRSSFVVATSWPTSATPGTILYTSAVVPNQCQTTPTTVAYTPMGYLSQHFQYWRGSIKFTFKIVRSPYHRGRLQIAWDRASDNLNEGAILGNMNTYNVIMDLDESDEVTVTVPWSQAKQFLQCYNTNGIPTVPWSTSTAPSASWSRSNGVINVRVMNRLTAPESTSDVSILVFVSAGDDFELAAPVEYDVRNGNTTLSLSALTTAVTQADVAYDDATQEVALAPDADVPLVYKEVFGERIVSLREYLHRSSVAYTWFDTVSAVPEGWSFRTIPTKRMPPAPGVFNNGWSTGTTTSGLGQRVFYTQFHPLVSIGSCFIGYKGSVNLNVNIDTAMEGPEFLDTVSIGRRCNGSVASSSSRRPVLANLSVAASSNVNQDQLNSQLETGVSGMVLTNTKTNTGLSANLPYYANSGFQLMNMFGEYNNQDSLSDANNDWWLIQFRVPVLAATTTPSTLTSVWYGSGPDFDLVYFINVPILTAVTITPV